MPLRGVLARELFAEATRCARDEHPGFVWCIHFVDSRGYDDVQSASTRGPTPAPAACPARPFASGYGAGAGGSAGRLTRNSSTYRAGRLPRVRNVATDSPPMMATASGPQNTLRVSGIMARIAV